MLRTDEALRVAHGRLKVLVQTTQHICGSLNPDEPTDKPRSETGLLIEELGAAWDEARDGLQMLRDAENQPTETVTMTARVGRY